MQETTTRTSCHYNGCAQRNHPTGAHVQCQTTTKKGKACPHHADRLDGGKQVCHVHDSAGKFRQNLGPKKEPDSVKLTVGDESVTLPLPKGWDIVDLGKIIANLSDK